MQPQLDWDDDAPDAAPALARAALLLGRLDGAISHISAEILAVFAIRSVRRALQASLATAGYPVSLEALTGWIGRTHGPPAPPDNTRVSAGALVNVVLTRLQRWPWVPLANAAGLVTRACPQLVSSLDREDRAALDRVAGEAEMLFEAPALPAPALPLGALVAAQAHADFVDGERGSATITTPDGPLVIESRGAIGQVWALGLATPPALARAGWSRIALPIFGSVPRRCLRPGLGTRTLTLYWAAALAEAAAAALDDLADAVQATMLARDALTTRRQSHAREAWALIAGLSGLRRSQVAAAFGMTLAGADQALKRLGEAGLIRRVDPRGPYVATTASPFPAPPADTPGTGAIAEVDAALAAIDQLLARSG